MTSRVIMAIIGRSLMAYGTWTETENIRYKPYAISYLLGRERARMEHFFGFEFARRKALAVTIIEQLVDLEPRAPKTPEIRIRTRNGLFFLPQSAVPESCLMHALPFEPFVASSFRFLPGVEHAERNPGFSF